MSFDLTGIWVADDGGAYFLRQSGNDLWWCGFSYDRGYQGGLTFTNVFRGNIRSQSLQGEWADVPRGRTGGFGELELDVSLDGNGTPSSLVKRSFSGAFSANKWDFKRQWMPRTGGYTIDELFELVNKNIWDGAALARESLADNLHPAKEATVVVLGRLEPGEDDPGRPFGNSFPSDWPRTVDCFWDMNSRWDARPEVFGGRQHDADMTCRLSVKIADLPSDFFDGISPEDEKDIRSRISGPINDQVLKFHPEVIMFGRTDGPPYVPLLPGWADLDGHSVLLNGRPINGDVVINNNKGVVSIAGYSPFVGEYVRITGVLAFDEAHDRQGDVEIHPVYSIDHFSVSGSDDLSGAWATPDGGTCYIRQLFNTVWFLWLPPYRNHSYATIFRGTRNGTVITGDWMDVPSGDRSDSGSLTLNLAGNKIELSPQAAGPFAGTSWRKLYDATGIVCPSVQVKIRPKKARGCMGLQLEGAKVQYSADVSPRNTNATFSYSWNVVGANGAAISGGVFEIGSIPVAGTQFTLTVEIADQNGCTYQDKATFTAANAADVEAAEKWCEALHHLLDDLHKFIIVQPPIPTIPPGDPIKLARPEGLVHLERDLTRLAEITRRIIELR